LALLVLLVARRLPFERHRVIHDPVLGRWELHRVPYIVDALSKLAKRFGLDRGLGLVV